MFSRGKERPQGPNLDVDANEMMGYSYLLTDAITLTITTRVTTLQNGNTYICVAYVNSSGSMYVLGMLRIAHWATARYVSSAMSIGIRVILLMRQYGCWSWLP
jgi:hypothetical protein